MAIQITSTITVGIRRDYFLLLSGLSWVTMTPSMNEGDNKRFMSVHDIMPLEFDIIA